MKWCTVFILLAATAFSNLLEKQREVLFGPPLKARTLSPVETFDHSGNDEDRAAGLKLLAEGKVGCIVLAGGQGSRLGTEEPKGMFPVTLIRNKTLFQLLLERKKAASAQVGRTLPMAFMTSPLNHEATASYLGAEDIFQQGMLPFLDEAGHWLEEAPGKVAEGPDGNGGILHAFYESGLWEKWKASGVESVLVVLIDNPLADPFDAELAGYHARKKVDVTVKCIARTIPEEKVGVFGLHEGKLCVNEYTELTEEQRNDLSQYGLASISLFCFDMNFIQTISKQSLPWHLQKKVAPIAGVKTPIWKYETYIFDLLPFAEKTAILCYPREDVFAPLKNATGSDSIATVQQALQRYDRAVFTRLTGLEPPDHPFELDPAFYYPTEEMAEKLKTLPPKDYYDPSSW